MGRFRLFFALAIICVFSCKPEKKDTLMRVLPNEVESIGQISELTIPREVLYDKVLGTLVGSAVGDAMGAPTEMWSRAQIYREYGYVDSLDFMVRDPSPEGTWDYNLPAGGTTDDTRWKALMGEFFLQQTSHFYDTSYQSSIFFAKFLVEQYKTEIEELKKVDSFEPAPFEQQMMRVSWLQEWAVVAKPFSEQDMFAYNNALSRFYGGEMVCAGLLYSPLLGVFYPNDAGRAYHKAYQYSLFDLGYARDITALNASMVAAAFSDDKSAIIDVLKKEDPQGYFKSRLVGRISYRIYRDALFISEESKKELTIQLALARDSTIAQKAAEQKAFELLDARQQDYPFHAGEIHLINLVALLFNDFAFRESLAFVVNYGRDNDTAAAITGAILGAYHGFSAIPEDLKGQVLQTNKNKLGIDLEGLAGQITERLFSSYH